MNTDDKSAGFDQHNDYGIFNIDLTKASGGSSLNPFISTTSGSSEATSSSPASPKTTDPSGYSSGATTISSGLSSTLRSNITAHGTIMGLAFL